MDDPRPPRDESVEELDGLLQNPARWASLDPDKLRHLLFYQCLSYGIRPDDGAIPALMGLHKVAVERLPPAVRRDVVAHLARAIERVHREHALREGAGCTNALLPFLLEDPDPTVVSEAAAEMALLLPLEDGDPLTGPRYVRSLLDPLENEDARAGILAGLLGLGDPRVAPLVAGGWSLVGEEGRQTLALLIQAFHELRTPTVEFLVAWLEEEVRQPLAPSFGVVAATLARAGRHAGDHGITEIERTFPITDAPESEPFRVIREWRRESFSPAIAGRLARVAGDEEPASLMPHVLSYWGLDAAAYLAAATAAARRAARAAGPGGVCEPVRLELVPDWPEEPERETFLEWGILSPFGPTVNTLRLTPVGEAFALVYSVYHPRASSSYVMGLLPVGFDAARVGALLRDLMRRNGDGGLWLLRSMPDYVHVPPASCLDPATTAAAIEAARQPALAAGEDAVDLSAHARRLGRLGGDPWGTIAGEIERERSDGRPLAPEGGVSPRRAAAADTGTGYRAWLEAAGAPAHVAAIRREIPAAWQKAQEAAERKPPDAG